MKGFLLHTFFNKEHASLAVHNLDTRPRRRERSLRWNDGRQSLATCQLE
jgi:hypothetical protein